jgi:hypothetical protein
LGTGKKRRLKPAATFSKQEKPASRLGLAYLISQAKLELGVKVGSQA